MFWWLANRQVFTHLQVALSTEHLKVDETVIPTMNPCSILSKNIDIYPHLPPTVFLQSAIVSDRVRCLGAPCIAFIHACIRTCFGGIFTFSEEIQGANGFLNPCVWPLLVMSIITLWIPVVESVYWPTTGACPAENLLIYLGACSKMILLVFERNSLFHMFFKIQVWLQVLCPCNHTWGMKRFVVWRL